MFSIPLALISCVAFLIFRPRAVVCNGLILAFYLAPMLKLFRRKVIVSYHGWTQFYVQGLAEKLTILFGNLLDCVFANSEGSRQDLCRLVAPEKIFISEHYADSEFFRTERVGERTFRELSFLGRYVVLYVGRLDEETNVGTLIRSIPLMLDKDSNILFLFCGKGSELVDAVRALEHRYEANVCYLDYISDRTELARLYAAVDVVWSCGDDTYLTRPAVESLATGTPIIIPDRPNVTRKKTLMDVSVPESLVPESIGRIVKTDDLEGAADVVLTFATGAIDFDSQVIRAYAETHYSVGNLSNILEVLESCCNRRGGGDQSDDPEGFSGK
jgi:glycosyltransferase involved in cell wall biosynthesis